MLIDLERKEKSVNMISELVGHKDYEGHLQF